MKSYVTKKTLGVVLTGAIVLALFFLASFVSREYEAEISALVMDSSAAGMLAYVSVTALAVVVAPVSTLPLIPLASSLWGWFLAGVLSIIGWVVGAQIAFIVSRKYGKPLIQKFISLDKLSKLESKIPEKNMFWTVVLLRMISPVDVLSYALGLFSRIKAVPFFLTTLLGVLPFAFIFAYLGTLSTRLQVTIVIEATAALILFLLYKKSGIKKILLAIVLVSISVTAFSYETELFSFIKKIEALSAGNQITTAGILIALKTLSAPLGFPGTPLTLLSGSLLGKILGTLTALIGNTLGATLAFLLSRYIFRDYVQTSILSKYPRIKKYEERIEKNAMQTVIILRLIPLFPFNALNFLLGVTKIPLQKYVIGSFIGMIPGTFLFVYFGGSLRALSPVNIFLAVAGVALLTYVGKQYEKRTNI